MMEKWGLIEGGVEFRFGLASHTHTRARVDYQQSGIFFSIFVDNYVGNSATEVNGIYTIGTTACTTRPINTCMQQHQGPRNTRPH